MITLIIYPTQGANSFVTLEEANTISEQFIGYEKFQNKTDEERKRLLIAAYYKIIDLNSIDLPEAPESCINEAQVEIAVYDNYYDLAIDTQVIQKAKVGPIQVEYSESTSQISAWPSRAKSCLTQSYNAQIQGSNNIPLYRS